MAEEFIIRITDDFSEGMDLGTGGKGKTPGGNNSGGSVLGGLKIGAGIGIAFKALESISGAVDSLLRPIKSIMHGIFRMLGEMLRPISDMVVMLLKPVLIMVKPFLDLLKTMMSPFMEIAKQFGRMAEQQMRAGNTTAAFNLATEAGMTILGPFIVSMASVGLQMATTMIVSSLSGLLSTIFPAAKEKIEQGSDAIIDYANGKLTDATTWILDGMLTEAQRKLEEAKNTYPQAYSDAMIEMPASMISEMKKQVAVDSEAMSSSMGDGLVDMNTNVVDMFGSEKGTATTTFRSGLDAMTSAIQTFANKVKDYADDINDISFNKPNDDDTNDEPVRITGGFGYATGGAR